MEELIERSPDVFVFHARCEEYEASTPYYPMRAPIRAVLGLDPDADTPEVEARLREAVARVDPVLVPWIPLLGILLGLDLPGTPETEALDDRFLRERLGEVTMKFLYTSLAGTATMLAIEDAHFMDEATRDLLLRLARAGSDLRQIMLVTHSDASTVWAPQGEDEPWALSLCLLPLPFRHTIAIAELATDDNPLPPHYIEEIARRSNGNALFLFELLETVRQTGSTDSLPDSVESSIAGDIDRLSPEDRTVLRYAAVLGASFDPRLLEIALRQEVTLDDERVGAAGRPRQCRARGHEAVPQHARSGRSLRGAPLPPPARTAQTDRRGDRGDRGRVDRRGGRGARTPLLRGTAMGQGLGVLLGRQASAP